MLTAEVTERQVHRQRDKAGRTHEERLVYQGQRLCLAWKVEWGQDWAQSDAYLGNVGLKATEPRGCMNLTAAIKISKRPRSGDPLHDQSQ